MAELTRTKDLLKRHQSRTEVFRTTMDSKLAAALKEVVQTIDAVARIETELAATEQCIQDRQDTLSNLQEQLSQVREAGMGLEAQVADLQSQIGDEQRQISSLEKGLAETKGRLESATNSLEQRKAQLTKVATQVDDLQRRIGKQQETSNQELAARRQQLTASQAEVQQIREANPVSDFLVSEGVEPPEFEILASLIWKGEVTLDELKKQAKVPPAVALRVVKSLEQKGIIKVSAAGRARLAKPLQSSSE
jgi:chromosome segregation ATPase